MFAHVLDFQKASLYQCLLLIAFNPTFWNVVARNEHRRRSITKFVGDPRIGCYVLAAAIFALGLIRDTLYTRALQEQPVWESLSSTSVRLGAAAIFIFGQVLVISSTYALGITGTYLGDYFGILMEERVESFPFNCLRDPMYVGSTMCFFAGALWYARPAGILISTFVWITYSIALHFEGPFTDRIYSEREAAKKRT